MKTTQLAPRLSASRPMAPVPAKRSRTFAPKTESERILNKASLALSDVGRILLSLRGGVKSFRPFSVPLTILKSPQDREKDCSQKTLPKAKQSESLLCLLEIAEDGFSRTDFLA